MKKIIALLLVLAFALTFVACGGGNESGETGTSGTESAAESLPADESLPAAASEEESAPATAESAPAEESAEESAPAEESVEESEEESYPETTPDEYFEFNLLEDGTYSIKAKDIKNMPAEVVLPRTHENALVTRIIGYAFAGCNNLINVTIPDSITQIDTYAFYLCGKLESVSIPASLTWSGFAAFWFCENLKRVDITDIDAWQRIQFDSSSFSNPLQYAHELYLNGELVTGVVVPDDISYVSDYGFIGCYGLTNVTIHDGVTGIGKCALAGCSSLTNVTIPDSVTFIGGSAFAGCSSLTNVTIPEGVMILGGWSGNIDEKVFAGCSSLTNVTIPDSVTIIPQYTFQNCVSLADIIFNGTKDQWNNIKKGNFWDDGTGDYTVHCTDGDLNKGE